MSDAIRLRITFAFFMSLLMTVLMSMWVTWLNIGFHPDFLARWRHAFVAAWPVAFFAVMLFAPKVNGLSQRLLRRFPRRDTKV
ncbi:hypothetical protein ACFDR9_000120 [Janthinobacterium sp. CG_23.3]|uniref:DUF2798 domain-containing protein n=1 Tax=unclassified Janthinobacterium TaxID=2610881 RepID=UPI0003465638|nr:MULTISPECIES: DUF2798 domain-containing protein [unclassified Janthinobacterium]MEC5160802.1 hypothetical protein [Janthinobacterium sp. CG_S6]